MAQTRPKQKAGQISQREVAPAIQQVLIDIAKEMIALHEGRKNKENISNRINSIKSKIQLLHSPRIIINTPIEYSQVPSRLENILGGPVKTAGLGFTLLHYAAIFCAHKDDEPIIECLLKNGANRDLEINDEYNTNFHKWTFNKMLEAWGDYNKAFIAYDARKNPPAKEQEAKPAEEKQSSSFNLFKQAAMNAAAAALAQSQAEKKIKKTNKADKKASTAVTPVARETIGIKRIREQTVTPSQQTGFAGAGTSERRRSLPEVSKPLAAPPAPPTPPMPSRIAFMEDLSNKMQTIENRVMAALEEAGPQIKKAKQSATNLNPIIALGLASHIVDANDAMNRAVETYHEIVGEGERVTEAAEQLSVEQEIADERITTQEMQDAEALLSRVSSKAEEAEAATTDVLQNLIDLQMKRQQEEAFRQEMRAEMGMYNDTDTEEEAATTTAPQASDGTAMSIDAGQEQQTDGSISPSTNIVAQILANGLWRPAPTEAQSNSNNDTCSLAFNKSNNP